MAATVPDQAAVIITQSRQRDGRAVYARWTFVELEALSNRYANSLVSAGFARGERTVVMVRPGIEFIALIFAAFKVGVVPVMIDPGMGMKRMLDCVRGVQPGGFVGIPLAHVVRVLCRSPFASIEHVLTVGRRLFWGGPTLDGLEHTASSDFTPEPTDPDETAAILFTSGATGPPKGVVYTHRMFDAQVRWIRDHYGIEPGEVDLPAFPLFALFSTAMGMTCVIPDMDPSRPARVDPARIVEAIHDHGVTSTFGSPTIWKRVGAYCVERDITLPTIRRVLVAGAPVQPAVLQTLRRCLSAGADVHTPYGATESLPVASISGTELADGCFERTHKGAGICVGKPLPGITLRLIRITDEPLAEWSDDLVVADGELGELVVAGEVVTEAYFGQARANELAKIHEAIGDDRLESRSHMRVWHRIGDIGYRDAAGRVWMCGRKSHRVETPSGMMCSVRCEAIFNQHARVARSALVGVGLVGSQRPVIVIEPIDGRLPRGRAASALRAELLELGSANGLTRTIGDLLFHPSLPVDVRHNAKINREALSVWADKRLR